MRRAGRIAAAAALATLVLAGCSNDSGGEDTATSTPASVAIKTFRFAPTPLRISTGTKVVWTNADQILHTVTSPAFDGRLDGAGTTFAHVFDRSGTFRYGCTRHTGMQADVIVTGKGA